MTRQEQIVQAAAHERSVSEEMAFMRGAQWADTHTDNGLDFEPKPLEECIEATTPTWQGVDVEKYIDEVRGRDEQPASREVDLRYMAGMKAAYDAAIEIASDWIKELCSNCYIMNYTDCCELSDKEIIDWFKREMKGDEI